MRLLMKHLLAMGLAVMTVSTAFAQTEASTFQDPQIQELYTQESQQEGA